MSERLDLSGRVIAVTGGGRGLGRAYAIAVAQHGADVIVNDLGSGDSAGTAGETVELVRSLGGVAVPVSADVATEDGAQQVVTAAVERFGRIDVLVNNAGILRDKTLANMTPELIDPVLDVNLRAAFFTLRAAWPVMRGQGGGRILNTTSASGLFGNFGQGNYAAAKLGVVGLTKVAAIEGKRHGILVNAIAPVAATDLTSTDAGRAAFKTPEQVAPLVVFLAGTAELVTGEVLLAGGGWFTRCVIGHGAGWYAGTEGGAAVSPEELAANWTAVTDVDALSVPSSAQQIAVEMQHRWDGISPTTWDGAR